MAFGIVSCGNIASHNNDVTLDNVSGANATAGAKQVTLTWSDPSNAVVNGAVFAKWGGTLVVRKENEAPSSRTDGTLVLDSKVRNAYSSTGYVDTNVENGKTYYYAFYPYSTSGTYSDPVAVAATPYFIEVTIPTFTGDTSFLYDGNSHTPSVSNPDEEYIEMSSDSTRTATNAGTYNITYQLKDNTVTKWKDGTFTDKTLTWYIPAASGELTLSSYTLNLDMTTTTGTITITQVGDGALSLENSNSDVVTASVSGHTISVSRVSGNPVGTANITVNAASTPNYAATYTTLAVICNNYKIMTVYIDESDSNPETCCTYGDDAVNMTPGSDEWDEWFGEYPCLFNAGSEVGKLNTMNFAEFEDGTTADITSGDAGDVMIAFPRHGLKLSKSGDVITVTMTDNPNDPNFEYMAHKRGSTDKDKFYLGVYMGYELDNKLRSLSDKTPVSNKSLNEFRTLAQANGAPNGNGGSGYDQHGFYQLVYLQASYLLKYKTLDSQTAVGKGAESSITTGGTETWGLNKGETTNSNHVKLFGIEDIWGNIYCWIDGFFYDNSYRVCTATENFNNSGTDYSPGESGKTGTNNWYWMTKAIGTTHSGFISSNGTSAASGNTTYYCDAFATNINGSMYYGGTYESNGGRGIFNASIYSSGTWKYTNLGSRLMYL